MYTLTSPVDCCLQGLAPHHDDVDIFVCQTEGSKRWRLYNPRKGFALPAQPSGDLPEDILGDPIMDVTLQVKTSLNQLAHVSISTVVLHFYMQRSAGQAQEFHTILHILQQPVQRIHSAAAWLRRVFWCNIYHLVQRIHNARVRYMLS